MIQDFICDKPMLANNFKQLWPVAAEKVLRYAKHLSILKKGKEFKEFRDKVSALEDKDDLDSVDIKGI